MFTCHFDYRKVSGPTVYCIRLSGSNRCYVGQAANIRKRVDEHRSWSKCRVNACPKFYNALRKYGEEAFELTILARCDAANLCDLEELFIKLLRCVEEGFNIASNVRKPMLGRKHTDEYKAMMRAKKLGIPRSPETREKMRQSNLGRVQTPEERRKNGLGNTGKITSESTKEKLRKASMERHPNSLKRQIRERGNPPIARLITPEVIARRVETCKIYRKSVSQFDMFTGLLIAVHESMCAAGRSIGKPTGNIMHCLKKRLKSAYGYVWKYTDECTQRPTPQPITLNN